jgi:uncharacterized protein DUF5681
MKIPPKKYEVGYGQPPKRTRWKKGQCGNPNRIRKCFPKPVVQTIDEFFAGEIDIVENGISRRVTKFEAVVLQLCHKWMAGHKSAMKVLLDCKKFAATRGEMGGLEVEVITDNGPPEPEKAGGKNG